MKLYVDESGTITTNTFPENRFFIIVFVECNDYRKAIRVFREAKKDYLNKTPTCKFNIKDEIKGSEMPYGMKKLIFERLSSRTDIVFHYQVIDNFYLKDSLKKCPSISFNYFIAVTLKDILNTRIPIHKTLYMLIDERNQSVKSLNSLEEYLKIEFMIKTNCVDDIIVEYKDSQTKDLIQIADIFVNTVFRICKNHAWNRPDNRNRKLLSICNLGSKSYFPKHKNNLDICK